MTENTVTLRLIRSFPHRNVKNAVFKGVDLNLSAQDFMEKVLEELSKRSDLPPPFRKFSFDAMKIEHQAFGAKTSDPLINTSDDDKLLLVLGKSLKEQGIVHETEISCFKMAEYREYQKNHGSVSIS
ncbi:hypothetical protein CAPTEDRAFT_223922 [Capitella teleta]|uniref:Uncharacterized protein n=1 Tax=Capitella teleta TaxID=283909 RepID=R7VA95_CAPTE|nr:hypothetical protein CAPTEDRAFT_223922 [Capitella teleta]|eukprot:ELU15733.1 hypothetical protein CAPTEDRAFT_223922 [Capitella teleta]